MNTLKLMAVASAALFTSTTLASDFTYDYVGLNYIKDDPGNDNRLNSDAFSLEFSKLITENIYFKAEYARYSSSFEMNSDNSFYNTNADVDKFDLGAGYRHEVRSNIDWFIEGALTYTEHRVTLNSSDAGSGTFKRDHNGFYASTGLNIKLSPRIESRVILSHVDDGEESSYIEYGIEGRFQLSKRLQATAGFITSSRGDRYRKTEHYQIGLNYTF